ncbi:unnamed protein product [Lactuca saligna]|uniref:Uncharacterized protein n=1 Tax=Lactuca saligna TaxID=75948 RepID=A0AA35ZVH4_LACSI|nr:unnamed protein product [Lactuca saligna]
MQRWVRSQLYCYSTASLSSGTPGAIKSSTSPPTGTEQSPLTPVAMETPPEHLLTILPSSLHSMLSATWLHSSPLLEPWEIEVVFASLGTKKVFEKFLTHRDPDPFYFPKDKPFGAFVTTRYFETMKSLYDTPVILPLWLSEEDVEYYTKKFEQIGFTGGINYYRCFDLKYNGNFLFNMLGKWKESEYFGQSVPVGGLAYYVTAPS